MRPQLFPAFAVAALVVFALPTPVAARWVNPDAAGYCAAGTCSRFGGIRAGNVKFCKPENCRDFTASNLKPGAAVERPPCLAVSERDPDLAVELALPAPRLRSCE